MSFQGDVWETFRAVDISKHVKKKFLDKGKTREFSYLSWSGAWSIVMANYPESYYSFAHESSPDGSVEVFCNITIVQDEKDFISRRCRVYWHHVSKRINKKRL